MFYSLLLASLLSLHPTPALPGRAAARPAVAAPAGNVEPCKIFGSIYLETDPRRKTYCFATVYVEPEEAYADLMVFKEDSKLFADKAGFWYPIATRDFADYVLFVTDNRALADFTIHYTSVRSYAGCRQ